MIGEGARNAQPEPHTAPVTFTDLTSIEDQAAERERKAEKARDAKVVEKDDLVWLLGSKRGRRIAWRVIRDALELSTFSTNAMQMAHNEGMRSTAQKWMHSMQVASPELFSLMQKEASE